MAARMNPRWLALNRSFVVLCLHLSSLSEQLDMENRLWVTLSDRITISWSCLIMVTSSIKFVGYPKRDGQFNQNSSAPLQASASLARLNRGPHIDWTEVALLNYLPRINQFASLYYGLVLLSVGTALVWRFYLKFLHRITAEETRRRFDLQRAQFDAKRELLDFFMNGPQPEERQRRHLVTVWRRARTRLAPSGEQAQIVNKGALLTRAHVNELDRGPAMRFKSENDNNSSCRVAPAREVSAEITQKYRIPIRSADFLYDKSQARWTFLAAHVYAFVVFLTLAAIPLTYLTIVGLFRVNEVFGTAESLMNLESFAEIKSIVMGANRPDDNKRRVNLMLGVYGFLEQAYTISQLAMFLAFTNIFVKLFHADLIYKVRPIKADFKLLCGFCEAGFLESIKPGTIHKHQIRVWAFFDQIRQFDSLLSKYSVASLTIVSIGISFGQSFFMVSDKQLRQGTLAALFSNALSFVHLHVISEHIERQSVRIQASILTILANERRPDFKRDWQRLLSGFFRSDWKRTFTINGKYPTNLRTFSKTATALLAACLLVHRLFHRPHWDTSFAVHEMRADHGSF